MTGRDRIVLIVVVMLAVLGGAWMLVVSPERKEASKLNAQVASAKAELASAESQLSGARAAQTQYASAYSSIVSLGKSVPAEPEVPSLIYQLAQASNQQQVDFNSISSGAGATTSTSSASSAAAAATAAAGFSQMPFTFVFNGGFFDLEHLFNQLTSFTTRTTSGALKVSGRLLTIQSVKLAPVVTNNSSGKSAKRTLSGTITATAYQLPSGQGVTGGATATSPTGTSTPASTTTGAASSPTAPAIARVTP
jgi:Tfp pilus assembly protein PilO